MKSYSLNHFLYHILHALEELSNHITDVDTLPTLKETLSIALKNTTFAAQSIALSTSAGNHSLNWRSRQQCDGFTDNTC